MELRRIYGHTNVYEYKVNPEFVPVFRMLGTTKPTAVLLPDIFLNNGRTTELFSGLLGVMRTLPCDDPRIARLERNLLVIYQEL